MEAFTCDWIFNILVVLCDGRVVCGCADPYGKRPLGDLSQQSLEDIWHSEIARDIRRGLNRGYAPFCLECGLKKRLAEGETPLVRPVDAATLPRIFFEPTVLCNLSCYGAVCSKESGIIHTRSRKLFPIEEFKTMIDPVGRQLIRLDFFNYGDPFCHPQAIEMVEWVKKKYPQIYLYTSTNGLMLDEEKSKRIVSSALDEITFSVDGADASTYGRYRQGGDFAKVMKIMERFMQIRNESGREVPFVNWRYILFQWNDSKKQMKKTQKLAARIGVDRLTWEITDHPEDAYSRKYIPGSNPWKRIYREIWDSSQIGSAIPKKQYRARIRLPNPPIRVSIGQSTAIEVKIRNIGGVSWLCRSFSGRRWIRLGAQLFSLDRQLEELNYARASLPRPLSPGEGVNVKIVLPPIQRQGNYWIKWDMVAEGMDWFENGGSKVVWRELNVF